MNDQFASRTIDLSPEQVWAATLGELELQMTRSTFNTWLKGAKLLRQDTEGGVLRFVVGVRNDYAKEWLDGRLHDSIARTLSAIAGQDTAVLFVVQNDERLMPEPPPLNVIQNGTAVNGNGRSSDEIQDGDGYSMPDNLGRDQVFIDLVEMPTEAFLATPHYAHKFWRPYLGLVPFSLWEVLRSYQYFANNHNSDWPTIILLSDSLGFGDRYTILGRNARNNKPAQTGALDVLVQHRLCKYRWYDAGSSKHRRYHFRAVNKLKILTPKQVAALSPRKQKEHNNLLQRYPDFDYATWERSTADTFMPLVREIT